MNLLFTADWQTRLSNLAQSYEAAKRLLQVCVDKSIDHVVVCGDIKHQYSPVDLRATEFWRWFVNEWSFIWILGNHDRVGLYSDEVSWLPILKDAGARVTWTADTVNLGPYSLYCLPFLGTEERWKEADEWLLKQKTDPERDILAFHQTIVGTKFSRTGVTVEPGKGIPLAALRPERYRYCIGGDVHFPQWLSKTVCYTGSPFAMDWGEVGQVKYFVVVTDDGLEWVPTGMPGWYDPDVSGFKSTQPTNWEGSRVRLRVPVGDGLNYGKNLELARAAALIKYPGAQITVLAAVSTSTDLQDAKSGLSEAAQLTEYVKATVPEELKDRVGAIVAYIEYKLRETGAGFRTGTGVQFKRIWAEHYSCFDKLELELGKPGVTVITGDNRDWPGRSNGVGKTSLLTPLTVALFGKTFKGQTFDGWVQRGWTGKALVGAEFVTEDGAVITVERTRNPVSVKLSINGAKSEAGGKSTDVGKDIETLCGYSWDVFANVVYMSQEEVGLFLWGTPKQRQDLLSKLQNLDRFGLALKIVGKELSLVEDFYREAESDLANTQSQLEIIAAYREASAEVVKREREYKILKKEFDGIDADALDPGLEKRLAATEEKARKALGELNKTSDLFKAVNSRILRTRALPELCEVCGQKISKTFKDVQLGHLYKEREQLAAKLDPLEKAYADTSADQVEAKKLFGAAVLQRTKLRERKAQLQNQLENMERDLASWKKREAERSHKEKEYRASIELQQSGMEALQIRIGFLRYVSSVLHRNGLPAHLSQSLLPRINKAAEYHSELFTDGIIKLRAAMEDGQVEIAIDNPAGGEKILDQSSGEGAMAALISVFALRESDRSNILVLDEPGDGLDPANAAAFAAGIAKLRGSWSGEIFLISHNASIISELAGERSIRLVKENGVSRIVTEA